MKIAGVLIAKLQSTFQHILHYIKNQLLNYHILFLLLSNPLGFTTVNTLEILKPK